VKQIFEKGDIVICLNQSTNFTVGKAYKIREEVPGMCLVTCDDAGSDENGWNDYNFRLANPEEAKAYKDSLTQGFKIGDWVYAERNEVDDFRPLVFVPTFQIKEIKVIDSNTIYLRPVEYQSTGVLAKLCHLATKEELAEYHSSFLKPIEGYPVEITKNAIGVGCHTYGIGDIELLIASCEKFNIKELKFSHNDITLPVDKINGMLEYAKSKNS
jgi:hypothetical protein